MFNVFFQNAVTFYAFFLEIEETAFCPYSEGQWDPKQYWTPHFFFIWTKTLQKFSKNLLLYLTEESKSGSVINDRISFVSEIWNAN